MTDHVDTLFQLMRDNGTNPALETEGSRITYNELVSCVDKAAETFTHQGIAVSQRIGLAVTQTPDSLITLLALLRIGAVPCLVNTRWPISEQKQALQRISAIALLNGNGELIDRFAANGQFAETSHVVVFTSGTATSPKAALLSVYNLIANARATFDRVPVANSSRWLLSLPLYHVGGLGILFRSLLSSSCVVIPQANELLNSSIMRTLPSHCSVVHTQLWRLLMKTDTSTMSLPTILLGGGPTTLALVSLAVARGVRLHLTYGLTETASQVATSDQTKIPQNVSVVGTPLSCCQAAVSDDGEILVTGESLFKGYLDESGIDPCRDANGWFHTGDLGELTSSGELRVCGRRDNMFISGGENIHPEAIESVIMSDPSIISAIVVPRRDPEYGMRPVAFIACDAALHEYRGIAGRVVSVCSDRLPKYMHPTAWYALPSGSSAGSIKYSRRELRESLSVPCSLMQVAP